MKATGNDLDQPRISKRNILKGTLVAGSTAIALPAKWRKPVTQTFVLPAHAATTGATFAIESADVSQVSQTCVSSAIGFSVSGTVSASDGSDLAGTSLTIEYTNEDGSKGTKGIGTVTFTTEVQPGNSYDSGPVVAVPPNPGWLDPEGAVLVRFTDQATFGASFMTADTTCDEDDDSEDDV